MDHVPPKPIIKHYLRGQLRSTVPALTWITVLIVLWESAGRILEIQPELLPTPTRILLEWVRDSDRLRAHGIITAAEVLGGFFLSLLFSMPASILIGLTPSLHRSLLPVIVALRRAPLIAATPLAFIWLGFGFRSIVLLACVLSFLTLTPGLVEGLRSVPENVFDLMRLANLGPISVFLKLRLPSCLPQAIAAMKTAVPLVVGVVVVCEFVDGQQGLGYLMLAAAFKLETSLVFAALAAVLLIGLVLYGGVVIAELALVRWRRA
jgi:NitT/TauT family transport system permease protein